MKGQLNIEFVASVLVFGILASYTAFFVYDLLPFFNAESKAESIRAKAFQISDLLIGDPGLNNDTSPGTNWTSTSVKRVGLALDNDPYVLNYTKIEQLNITNSDTIKNGFYSGYGIRIRIQNVSDSSQDNYLVDKSSGSPSLQAINIIRVAPARLANGKYEKMRILLTVWNE